MMIWKIVHPQATVASLGFLPGFFSDRDPRPAREQLDANYAHGGGYDPMPGFEMLPDRRLQFLEEDEWGRDPPLELLAESKLRDETLLFYDNEFLAIVQSDGSFAVVRCD
jgi:hypothetical protein